MRVPDSLFVRFQPSFSVTGVFLLSVYPLRTGCTVFRPIGAWDESRAAHHAPLHAAAVKDLRFKSLVQRQNRPAEPFATNGIRNRLRAGVGFPIVQQQAVAAVIVGAQLPQQGVDSFRLLRCDFDDHWKNLLSLVTKMGRCLVTLFSKISAI